MRRDRLQELDSVSVSIRHGRCEERILDRCDISHIILYKRYLIDISNEYDNFKDFKVKERFLFVKVIPEIQWKQINWF